MTVSDLPLLNASLNGLSTIFILAGWWFIRHERKRAHIACMLTALCTSTAFLTSYLTYHWLKAGHVTEFTHPGWAKVIYLTILWTHIPLAGLTVVLVIVTVIPALRARYDRHKRIGRWTMPVWLYVSVTGVLVYMMLYQWFPPVRA